MSCKHEDQMLGPSRVAAQTGYCRPNKSERAKAAGLVEGSIFDDADYPGPLVLPNDEIDFDPGYPPQSFSDWQKHITPKSLPAKRRKIYFAAPPGFTKECRPLWRAQWPREHLLPPRSEDVLDYLAAFYRGFEVVELPKGVLIFDTWAEEHKSLSSAAFVALNTPKESIRIRKRPMPNNGFGFQLNLNDLLDAAIAVLPDDALALNLLVDFDMYEDDDDDFVCGRAYGGSHVCVVSSFRYNPQRDKEIELDRDHIWPASHCIKYVEDRVDKFIEKPARKPKRKCPPGAEASTTQPSIPLRKAIEAHKVQVCQSWLNRVCRTASHELGHCMALDHCMYYACIMQGSASVSEDLRQPPYLCPVDDAKLNALIAARGDVSKGSVANREKALLAFAKRHWSDGGFAAFQAWLEARQEQRESDCSAFPSEGPMERTFAAAAVRPELKTEKRTATSNEEPRRSKRIASRS